MCSDTTLSPPQIARIADWNQQGVDWDEFLRLAEHHGMLALAAKNLLAHARGLPAQIMQSLCRGYEENVRRNLWFAGEMVRIADHFEKRKLLAVPYKGPALAESVYGDLALRNFGDLDWLIAPADFELAKQALADLGYQPSTALRKEVERLWLRTGYECSFDGAAGKYLVELQWRPLPHFYAVDLKTEKLLQRSGRGRVGGRELPALSAEDLLLILCLHAAKHLWMRLIWIVDIAETMSTLSPQYDVVLARSRCLGITRILGVSFWLVKNVLGSRLPECGEEMIARDSQVPVLGEEFAGRLARGTTYNFESSEYFRFILRLRERRLNRWRYLWRLVWTPGAGDISAVRLPEALFPLYRLVRVARLMRKRAS